ncbi:FAD-binding protein [Alkalicaulis satelles]|uniref:FAD-binding protein n=1 Tax=Alkalicaulis satelles TaxID=2609175 RepID=A0A5M6ZKT6_9PROT|nr:FAD-dependent oxidoreductase [Alkalicaulis satelles]KAA5804930.1 FAD-binding protein [Alkalicaulis satelles]
MSRDSIRADLAVIGAGAAGLVTSAGAAMLGRKVVLFEAGEMGGDCLNYGCVPSKALLTAAHKAHEVRQAARWGVQAELKAIDFAQVRKTISAAIAAIEPNDSQARFEGLGVKVVRERARFTGPRTVASDSVSVTARRIVIASGTRARIPAIEGLDALPVLTNESIWSLESLPQSLIILGAGPIGVELGQAFARLGSQVTIIEPGEPLARFEPEHAALVLETLKADGVTLITGEAPMRASGGPGAVEITLADGRSVTGTHILAAAGREPVLDGLGLDAAGVQTDAGGLIVDDRLRTTNKRVLAAGDIAGKGGLTHLAGWHGSVIIRNLYFGLPTRQSSQPIPQAVYCDPPLANAGLTQGQAREIHGAKVQVTRWPFADNDRAIAEGDTRGGVILVSGKGAKLLGAHAAGARADDLIHLASAVMARGGTVRDLTNMVAAYPTRAEIFKRAGGKYYESAVFGPFARTLAGVLNAFH